MPVTTHHKNIEQLHQRISNLARELVQDGRKPSLLFHDWRKDV
jgi:hypothetical protein